jgi:hypothetical protein
MTTWWRIGFGLAIGLLLLSGRSAAQAACENPISCENTLEGSQPSEWDVDGAGDPTIQGFATSISARPGERIDFKIDTDAVSYRLDIYRIGYYGGLGARRVATVDRVTAVRQPGCLYQVLTGLVDCGNWSVTASWQVPAGAVSGVYVARAVRSDTGGASHVPFIVRSADGDSDILVQVADTTWQAYNDYGGNSLYAGHPRGRAYKVSYNRPMVTRGNQYARTYFWATSYPMIRWLEANGYDVSYTTGTDTDRDRGSLLGHRVFLSVGHDEYWSEAQRLNVEAARDAGVHLAFFSGNTMFWRTRWEPSIDEGQNPHRTLVSYKDTHEGRKIDPEPGGTGTWRDPRFGHDDGSGRPENALLGTLFIVNCCRFDSIVVSAGQGRHRFWRDTDLARQADGTSMAVGRGIVGFEWDGDVDNGHRPPGLTRLSSTTVEGAELLVDFGSDFRANVGPATHNLTLYRHVSGALVFSAGTIHWGWALDDVHDDPDGADAPVDVNIKQATVNLLADMGVMPSTLEAGVTLAVQSQDSIPPTATILWPAVGDVSTVYREVVVTGQATDEGGGIPAGVEISLDGGTRWAPADGGSSWTYRFRPMRQGPVMVLARAIDDSGNVQAQAAWASFEVGGFGLRRLALWLAAPAAVAGLGLVSLLVYWRRRRLRRGERMA